jgi:hypothetical protein
MSMLERDPSRRDCLALIERLAVRRGGRTVIADVPYRRR